jgi:DNA-binding transcriptional regulator YdaS (Cro superfamily)
MHSVLDMHVHRMHKERMMTLNEYLEKSGESDGEFAAKVGLSPSQISRLRRGVSKPSWDGIVAIEKVTGGQVQPNDWPRGEIQPLEGAA